MVRTRPLDFMDRLIAAGLEIFGSKGFHSSRMSDVARSLKVSQGTLYNYVESKEALFALMIERGADREPVELPSELPIPAISTEELATRLAQQLPRTFALPKLERALTRELAEDPRGELAEILGELWETTATTRGHADALERSMPDLAREVQLVFFGFRRGLFEKYARYIASRVGSGQFRDVGSPVVPARFLIENVTLFARHCHRDPDPAALPDSETLRIQVSDLVLNSLVSV